MASQQNSPDSSKQLNREFIINVAFLLAINLLIKPFFIFGIDLKVQNTVPAGDYGLYFSLLNFTYLIQIVNDFGIQYFNNRNISQHRQLIDKYFPNIIVLKFLLAFLYLILSIGFALALGYRLDDFRILGFLLLNQIFLSFIFFLRSNISGLRFYRRDSFLSAFDKLMMILICSILLWLAPFKDAFQIEWFVYAQTASYALTALVAFLFLYPHLSPIKLRFNWPFLALIIKKSYPYAISVFLIAIYTRVDAVMIERLLPDGKFEADIYASAYRLMDASNMLIFLVAGLLLPMFARLLKDKVSPAPLLKMSFQSLYVCTLSVTLGAIFYRNQLMELLYIDATNYSGQVLAMLIPCFLITGIIYTFGTLITATGKLRRLNYIFATCVALNIGLNLILIPEHKALGASAATLATQGLVAVLEIFLCFSIFKFRPQLSSLFRLFVFSTGVFGISYLVYHLLPQQALIGFFSICALALLWSFPSGIIKPKELLSLRN